MLSNSFTDISEEQSLVMLCMNENLINIDKIAIVNNGPIHSFNPHYYNNTNSINTSVTSSAEIKTCINARQIGILIGI